MSEASGTLGLILAGGLARRMGGGDKTLMRIGGQTILERVRDRLRLQTAEIVLNANGDPTRFAFAGMPVIPDNLPDYPGPLAGILAGLDWAAEQRPDTAYVASVPGDCPFIPRDLVARLHAARIANDVPLACARSGEWRHPVAALWPVALRNDLREALTQDGMRKVEAWTARHGIAIAEWPVTPADPFFNINTPEDAQVAEMIVAREIL